MEKKIFFILVYFLGILGGRNINNIDKGDWVIGMEGMNFFLECEIILVCFFSSLKV